MPAALIKAFAQLPDPRFRAVVWRALIASVVLFAAMFALIWWGLDATRLMELDWLETVADVAGLGLAFILGLMLFPGAVFMVIAFMLEDIAGAVEARHYPGLAAPLRQPIGVALRSGLRLAAMVIGFNMLALPVYVVLFWLPPLNLFVFYGLNGYLLGREYFELVAFRRLGAADVAAMWRASRGRLWMAGVVSTGLLSIPLVSWLMPVVAVAFTLHIFEDLRRRAETS